MDRKNTYRRENVEIVVHRPEIDDKERLKREETIRRALATFGKAAKRQGVVV